MPIVRFEPLGVEIAMAPGTRVLDAVDEYPQMGVPYACRAANCGICRVRPEAGAELLSPPDAREQRLLARLDCDPGVRLGCQVRLVDDTESGQGDGSRLILRVLAGRA